MCGADGMAGRVIGTSGEGMRAARDGAGGLHRGDRVAGAPAWGTFGARWFALRAVGVVSAATPPALQPIDLGIGARVGCGALKNMTRGGDMLGSGWGRLGVAEAEGKRCSLGCLNRSGFMRAQRK